jgi:hypothetical protein
VKNERHLEKLNASKAAYHSDGFSSIGYQTYDGNVGKRVRTIMVAKRNDSFAKVTFEAKVFNLTDLLGLLDKTFSYLNISHSQRKKSIKLGRERKPYQIIDQK